MTTQEFNKEVEAFVLAYRLNNIMAQGGRDDSGEDEDWVTINHTHVLLDKEGDLTGKIGKKIRETSKKSSAKSDISAKIDDLEDMGFGNVRTPIKIAPLKEGWDAQEAWGKVKVKDRKKLPVEEVDTDDIYTYQKWVDKSGLKKLNEGNAEKPSSDYPMAVRKGGKVIIMDGNHRVAYETLKGTKSLKVRVYNADGEQRTDAAWDEWLGNTVREFRAAGRMDESADCGTQARRSDSKSIGGVGVYVVDPDGRILVGTRKGGDGSGQIGGPGGHIEEGETPGQAAIRVTQEEFGITPMELIPFGKGEKLSNGIQPYLFLCLSYEGMPECDDDEMCHARFVPYEEIETSGNLFPAFKNGCDILLKKIYENEYNEEKNY